MRFESSSQRTLLCCVVWFGSHQVVELQDVQLVSQHRSAQYLTCLLAGESSHTQQVNTATHKAGT